MSSPAPPERSEASQRWLAGVRAQVKERLFGPNDASIGSGQTHAAGETETEGAIMADPTRIGRFVVIKRIGQGGMGVIYAAYDDQLDRKVAVKLLRPDGGGGTGADGRVRLMREAQALARLSHESVIAVYEVGTYEDQVYVAMEFVDGGTLKHWQNASNRRWREVLDTYLAAGRGLAAAHVAGIVHRDFKPDNVLVRKDGAVRVVDFGLARREVEGPTPEGEVREALGDDSGVVRLELAELAPSSIVVASGRSPAKPALTRTGVIMGTPAYMAPEQHLGIRAEPRSDQFSYCVSLYEALYGFRPFAGTNLPTLRKNVLTGNLQEPPRYTDIPPRIHAVLARGLSVDPEARYSSMESLLEELVRDPKRLLWRAGVLAAAALLLGFGLWMYWADREERAVRAEGQALRQRFERARVVSAEAQLRHAQSRSVSEKWDDLVLSYAREQVAHDPTRALAALKHLSPDTDAWLMGAKTIASDAQRRGVIHRTLRPLGEFGYGRIDAMRFTETSQLFFASGGGTVRRWAEGDVVAAEVGSIETRIRGLAVDRLGTRVAVAAADGTTHLWDLVDNTKRMLQATDGPLTAIALTADGSVLATGAKGGALRLRNWNGTPARTLGGHGEAIRGLDFSGDGSMLASGSDSGDVILWRLERKTHLELGDHNAGVTQVLFSNEDRRLLSVGEDGEVRFWSTESGSGAVQPGFHGVRNLRIAADDSVSLVINNDQSATLLGVLGTEARLEGLPAAATAAALTQDGSIAAVAAGDGSVLVWKLAQGQTAALFPDGSRVSPAAGRITALAWDPEGRRLATGTVNGSFDLWNPDGTHARLLGQIARGAIALAFSPNGHDLAGLDGEGVLLVWPIADAPKPHLARPQGQRIRSTLAWAPDGSEVAAIECQAKCTIALHRRDGSVRARLPETPRPADHIRFSPDGQWLVSEHDDEPHLYRVAPGEETPLHWPPETTLGKRVAVVFAQDGASVRFATSTPIRDLDDRRIGTTLQVWQASVASGDVQLLFEEPELSLLVSDDDFDSLLLRTRDDRTLLWTLDDDSMRMLPSVPDGYSRLLVSPSRESVLLIPDDRAGQEPRLIHVQTGQSRGLSRLHDPVAWSTDGVVADVGGVAKLRVWLEATPSTVPGFLQWLDTATDQQLDPSTIR